VAARRHRAGGRLHRAIRVHSGSAYAHDGYEATFGRYEIDDRAHRFTLHVEGALVRSLIGKDLRVLWQPARREVREPRGALEGYMGTLNWTNKDLTKIAATHDLHIAPFRPDGWTYGTPTWIWSVVVDGDLYVRAYNGQESRWYQAALRQKAGRITAAGMMKEVTFEPVDGPINDRIDAAYDAKYHGNPYLGPMVSPRARFATVRVLPKEKRK